MRKLLPLLAASMLIGGAAQAKPVDHEAELARRLAGRVAGEPVQCIDLHRVRSSQVINDTAIVWDAGGVVYVSRPGQRRRFARRERHDGAAAVRRPSCATSTR